MNENNIGNAIASQGAVKTDTQQVEQYQAINIGTQLEFADAILEAHQEKEQALREYERLAAMNQYVRSFAVLTGQAVPLNTQAQRVNAASRKLQARASTSNQLHQNAIQANQALMAKASLEADDVVSGRAASGDPVRTREQQTRVADKTATMSNEQQQEVMRLSEFDDEKLQAEYAGGNQLAGQVLLDRNSKKVRAIQDEVNLQASQLNLMNMYAAAEQQGNHEAQAQIVLRQSDILPIQYRAESEALIRKGDIDGAYKLHGKVATKNPVVAASLNRPAGSNVLNIGLEPIVKQFSSENGAWASSIDNPVIQKLIPHMMNEVNVYSNMSVAGGGSFAFDADNFIKNERIAKNRTEATNELRLRSEATFMQITEQQLSNIDTSYLPEEFAARLSNADTPAQLRNTLGNYIVASVNAEQAAADITKLIQDLNIDGIVQVTAQNTRPNNAYEEAVMQNLFGNIVNEQGMEHVLNEANLLAGIPQQAIQERQRQQTALQNREINATRRAWQDAKNKQLIRDTGLGALSEAMRSSLR